MNVTPKKIDNKKKKKQKSNIKIHPHLIKATFVTNTDNKNISDQINQKIRDDNETTNYLKQHKYLSFCSDIIIMYSSNIIQNKMKLGGQRNIFLITKAIPNSTAVFAHLYLDISYPRWTDTSYGCIVVNNGFVTIINQNNMLWQVRSSFEYYFNSFRIDKAMIAFKETKPKKRKYCNTDSSNQVNDSNISETSKIDSHNNNHNTVVDQKQNEIIKFKLYKNPKKKRKLDSISSFIQRKNNGFMCVICNNLFNRLDNVTNHCRLHIIYKR